MTSNSKKKAETKAIKKGTVQESIRRQEKNVSKNKAINFMMMKLITKRKPI